ncbi:Transposon Ty3-I Gag-Pol polyprotein [Dictyocoela muelleri]|nr:Transposon Ty3-I Gag-Pol polyprotein [Dictyocoela muelleri]
MADFEFSIPTISDYTPTIKPYVVPIHQRKLLMDEIKRLLYNNIIKRSRSMFSAPCFIKKKNDGTGRILVDYRYLNLISRKIEYSFLNIHETFHEMHNIKYFSKLDLKKGFYQIRINKNDQHKTAFTTCIGKFEFKSMPFGLLNVPKFFHNIMLEKLAGIKNIKIFIDDILVLLNLAKKILKF